MDTIKAIPAKYKGVTFRSRLEARWAMFFDELGIKWAYEYEGFDLPSGLEIKPFAVNEVRLIELEAMTKKQTLMGIGNPAGGAHSCCLDGEPIGRNQLMKCAFCGHATFGRYPFGITCRECWIARVGQQDFLRAMNYAEEAWEEAPTRCGDIVGDGWHWNSDGYCCQSCSPDVDYNDESVRERLVIKCEDGNFYLFYGCQGAVYTSVLARNHHASWTTSLKRAEQKTASHRFH